MEVTLIGIPRPPGQVGLGQEEAKPGSISCVLVHFRYRLML